MIGTNSILLTISGKLDFKLEQRNICVIIPSSLSVQIVFLFRSNSATNLLSNSLTIIKNSTLKRANFYENHHYYKHTLVYVLTSLINLFGYFYTRKMCTLTRYEWPEGRCC